jgi:hypothetical protein
MQSSSIHYIPAGNGDVTLDIPGLATIPLSHSAALSWATSILRAAGVRSASFEDGTLTVLEDGAS